MARSPKAEETRRRIVSAALSLFRSGGYDQTTMRAIAAEADVSLGNAYYYFSSKEHLIQAYYDQVQEQHAAAAEPVLASEAGFADRLRGVLTVWVDVSRDYHEFAASFFTNAADPASPLSPFSPESVEAREAAIGLHRRVVEGSDLKVPAALRADLPRLLWLVQMGVVLFWVYDGSPDQRRTRLLIDGVVPIIDRAIRLSRIPGVRGIVDDVVGLLRRLGSGA